MPVRGGAPGPAYNPLFIYGGVGLGKTHLLHAIGNDIARALPGPPPRLPVDGAFTNELINAIRYDRMEDFRRSTASVDVLLIDDIQFIAGKERTQEEFFHTFNDALRGAQADRRLLRPRRRKEIPELEDRLRSRFEWGLIADIQPPDFETRVAILRKKAEAEGVDAARRRRVPIARRVKPTSARSRARSRACPPSAP